VKGFTDKSSTPVDASMMADFSSAFSAAICLYLVFLKWERPLPAYFRHFCTSMQLEASPEYLK